MSQQSPFLGRGWSFPPAFSLGGADVETVAGPEDIHQSLQILLGTAPGERVMQELFGCDLSKFLFEEIDQGLLNSIQQMISNAVLEYEPRVKLDQVSITTSDTEASCLIIRISYTVSGNNSRFNMVFPFYLTEAARQGV